MFYNMSLKSSCLLRYAWICLSVLLFFCDADVVLKSGKMSNECERLTLQEMDPSTSRNIGAPKMLAITLHLIDCRLYVMGKPPLQCSGIHQRGFFTCKYPVDEMVVNEIILTLLDVFERCHSTFANHFATETSRLLEKLSSSTENAEEMNARLIKSKLPLELIRQVNRIQNDAHLVETVVLKKANALKKKVADMRRSISNRSLKSNVTDSIGGNFWQLEDCFRKPTGAEGAGCLLSESFTTTGFCFNQEHLEWAFSIACTVLFLLMICKIERSRERAFSSLVGLLLFAARAYSRSQNYITFLEQFFLETVTGFSLLALVSMVTTNVRL